MSAPSIRTSALAFALAVALGGCARHHAADLAGPEEAPPALVTGLMPASRSTGVLAETDIWADFDRDLDPATLGPDRIFLKRDTRRIPIAITWEPARRRVHIEPQALLELLRTHTVSFGDGVRAADGAALEPFFWQFRTNGVRRPAHPSPAAGTVDESAFVPLAWDSTEPTAGTIRYEIFESSDSASVAARTAPAVAATGFATYAPDPAWTLGETHYWSVRATNLSTGEVAEGPVWRFGTLSTGLPVDSLTLVCSQWASVRHVSNFGDVRSCFSATVGCGPSYNGAMDWELSGYGDDLRLADAVLVLTPSSAGSNPNGRRLTISGTEGAWMACGIGYPGPPYDDPTASPLAIGEVMAGNRVRFHSPRLASHLESRMRGRARFGYRLDADSNFGWASPTTSDPSRQPRLVVYIYRRNAFDLIAGRRP